MNPRFPAAATTVLLAVTLTAPAGATTLFGLVDTASCLRARTAA